MDRKTKSKPTECKLKLKVDETERNCPILNTNDNNLKIHQLEDAQKFLFRLAQYTGLGPEVATLKSGE